MEGRTRRTPQCPARSRLSDNVTKIVQQRDDRPERRSPRCQHQYELWLKIADEEDADDSDDDYEDGAGDDDDNGDEGDDNDDDDDDDDDDDNVMEMMMMMIMLWR